MTRDQMIIKVMSSKFWNHYWHGYDALKDSLWLDFNESVSEREVKMRVKALRVLGNLVVRPTWDHTTGMLNGSGYFVNPQTLEQ